LLVLNIFFWVPILLVMAAIKLGVAVQMGTPAFGPGDSFDRQRAGSSCNSGWMALTQRTEWNAKGLEGLQPDSWYMVSSNHQSWVSVFVLQHLLNRRIPLLKFFLKTAADLGTGHGLGLVGTGVSLHAPAQRGLSEEAPGDAPAKTRKPRAKPAKNLHSFRPVS